ncbi:uncharacterized protein LOC120152884 [Hibiscus syriacus]|uniref:uncharacterized protein LOC120152884 n=1 Tax=Hibiscus syriacus TaxID=106335 RepID=UPI0019238CC1|nr:uncharacterized protein LOC120152884 [Hibiscus syriacus]
MRNQQLHTGKSTGIEALTSFIKNHTQEFELAQRRFQASFPPQHVHWKLPRALWVKANFDASFNQASRNGWSGVNVRDEEGNILGSCKKKVIRITSSFAAEAMTAVHAIQLVIDMGLTRVCFEEDSGAVIQRLASNEQDISERENNLKIGVYVMDGRRLSSLLHARDFRFVPRPTNKATHLLASFHVPTVEVPFWVEEAPAPVALQVAEDRRLLDPP